MLEKDWGWKNLLVAPHLIPQVQSVLRKGNWGVTAAIHRDMDSSRPFIVGLWPGLKNEAYGVACDIGSTTIAMHLVSLLSGRVVASGSSTSETVPNPRWVLTPAPTMSTVIVPTLVCEHADTSRMP